VGLLALVAGVVPLASAATADPISDKRAQAQQVANQLQQLSTKAEQLSEKYNGARVAADQIQADVVKAQADVAQANQRLAEQRIALRDVAIQAYVGEAAPTITPSADIAVQRTYVDVMSNHQQQALDSIRQARLDLAAHQQDLDRSQQKAQALVAQVNKDRQAASSAVAGQQAVLSKVNGELATLVAEEQQRQAAAEAERAKQELLRQQALAAAAAASRARQSVTTVAPRVSASPTSGGSSGSGSGGSAGSSAPPSKGAAAAIAEAQRQLGKPYQWGAAGPGSYDCSGLTMVAWRAAGVSLDHYTGAQYAETTHVSLDAIQPGDLIFYGSDLHHVGLYVGNGQMIEAPSTGYNVRYASIYRSDLYAASRPSA
jgi:cell wall-associated NlpC family hydrolase